MAFWSTRKPYRLNVEKIIKFNYFVKMSIGMLFSALPNVMYVLAEKLV